MEETGLMEEAAGWVRAVPYMFREVLSSLIAAHSKRTKFSAALAAAFQPALAAVAA